MCKARRFTPTFDALESREVPAGNVTAVVLNGNLIVTGDAEANEIEIRNDNGNVRLLGIAGGTTVNGVAFETFSGVFKDVILNLKGGADLVHLDDDAIVSRDLVFNGGGGADRLTGEAGAQIGRDLVFNGGGGKSDTELDRITIGRHAKFSGNDNVFVEFLYNPGASKVNGLLSVTATGIAGLSADHVELGRLRVTTGEQAGVDLANVLVGGNARITGGTGNDLIGLQSGNQILGNLVIETGAGIDGVLANAEVGGNVNIQLGGGGNQALTTSELTVYGNLTVGSTGNASDDWTLAGVDVFGRTRLDSGGGADTVFDDALFLGATTYLGGAGDDVVEILNASFAGTTLFDLGNGADTLQLGDGVINDADFSSAVTLNGGAGIDTLNNLISEFSQAPVIQSF